MKWVCGFLAVMLAPGVVWGQGPSYAVLMSFRATNIGTSDAEAVVLHVILPNSNRYQDVIDLKISPEPAETRTDLEGQDVVAVPVGPAREGGTVAVRVLAWVRPKTVNVPLVASTTVEPLSEEERAGQLADGWLLQLDKVRPIAEKAVAGRTGDVARARALYDHMAANCRYNIDDVVDTADVVLSGKPASCSELTFAYIALCRSIGIPARVVSAYVNRGGLAPSADWVTHRWAEFFAEGVGWVPVDPTNRINDSTKNFFGRQDGRYLAVVDDGVELPDAPDPGWQTLLAFWKPDDVRMELSRSAVWRVSANRREEERFFHDANEALLQVDPARRRQAVEAWDARRQTLALGFLLEALFDTDAAVRAAAASSVGRSGDVNLIRPLIMRAEAEIDSAVKQALIVAAKSLLDAQDEERRAEAVRELANSRSEEVVELLDGIWEDSGREVRKMTAQHIYKLGDRPMVHTAYRRLVADEDEFIRILSALRWSRVGSAEANRLLVGLLESRVQWDRENALAELQKHTGDSFGFDPRSAPTSRRNAEALARFNHWMAESAGAAGQ